MKISVIIPFFNKLKNLDIVLHNLKNVQTSTPEEIIVVDDDSTENTLDELKDKYGFINIKTNISNDGQHRAGQARNRGYSQATGDILIFQDNDVILGKHYIEYVRKYYETQKEGIVTGAYLDIDEQVQGLETDLLFSYLEEHEKFIYGMLDKTPSSEIIKWLPEATESRQFAIPKQMFKEIGCFDEKFIGWGCEDTEFFYRAKKIKNIESFNYRRLYSFHMEHPVDMVVLMDSMKTNAEYFISLYPEIKNRFSFLWSAFDVFGNNKRLRQTYNKVKELREKTGNKDFGKLISMRAKGLWVY